MKALRRLFPIALSLVGGFAGPIDAQPTRHGPKIVSPGSTETVLEIEGRCPTYHWAGVEGAQTYELHVYPEEVDRNRAPVVEIVVPGTASGWTPSTESCLEPGRAYSWYVRAHGRGGPTEWSAGGWFHVSKAPSADEVLGALSVLRRYLDQVPPRASESAPAQSAERATGSVGAGAEPLAAGPPSPTGTGPQVQLSDGDVIASGLVDAGRLKAATSTTTGTVSATGNILTSGGDILAGSGKKVGFRDPPLTQGSNFEEVSPGVRVRLNGVVFPDSLANLQVHAIEFNKATHEGSTVTKSGGGTGFFEVGSAINLDVDDNTHTCVNGGVVVGFRFKEQPTDQLAFDLICTD